MTFEYSKILLLALIEKHFRMGFIIFKITFYYATKLYEKSERLFNCIDYDSQSLLGGTF